MSENFRKYFYETYTVFREIFQRCATWTCFRLVEKILIFQAIQIIPAQSDNGAERIVAYSIEFKEVTEGTKTFTLAEFANPVMENQIAQFIDILGSQEVYDSVATAMWVPFVSVHTGLGWV